MNLKVKVLKIQTAYNTNEVIKRITNVIIGAFLLWTNIKVVPAFYKLLEELLGIS